ncbi:MAG TPA: SsrA-binding protein SmpB [Granulicella sp.]|jgi:SsrA-binding protein|nr:SsrA-binding protein SmpB [Granulicella sp.]
MARSSTIPTSAGQPKPAVKQKDRDPVAAGARDAAFNRAASHNYFLTDRFEAGVALRGTEVKSIREGKANLKDSYGLLKDGECFLLNAHIGPFSHGNAMNHESLRTRKLLLHKHEVRKLEGMTKAKGFTLIPTRLYFRNGRVKCELALAKGKQEWDKRATERKREADNEAKAAMARGQRR